MLEVRNLTKRYNGISAVQGVNFAPRAGDILGDAGPIGDGKSTAVKMIIGLLEPGEGQIL
jgi:ABC-type multidrug transport system ATPase subunit